MAEFGENLKKKREERGLTQQTLADHLFVTRQAVSRWEGGSRYPDLMTAKKLAQFLDTSLDELVSDKDAALYVEKNAILESPVSKGIQTAFISCAFVCYLILSIWDINELRNIFCLNDPLEILLGLIGPLKEIALAAILGYGILMSIRDRLNPRLASHICVCFFGASFFTGIILGIAGSLLKDSGYTSYSMLALAFMNLVICYIIVNYFHNKKVQSPMPIYMIAGVYGAASIVLFSSEVSAAMQESYSLYFFTKGVVWLISGLLLLGLLCWLAHELYLKRKRSMI